MSRLSTSSAEVTARMNYFQVCSLWTLCCQHLYLGETKAGQWRGSQGPKAPGVCLVQGLELSLLYSSDNHGPQGLALFSLLFRWPWVRLRIFGPDQSCISPGTDSKGACPQSNVAPQACSHLCKKSDS